MPVTDKQLAGQPVCKAILVQNCPVYGFHDVSPKPIPTVQLLSPINEHSVVFDLAYHENAQPRSVGEALEGAILQHGELPTANLDKYWGASGIS